MMILNGKLSDKPSKFIIDLFSELLIKLDVRIQLFEKVQFHMFCIFGRYYILNSWNIY